MNESIIVETFSNILIEFVEVNSNLITIKPNQVLEKIDNVFSFGKTNYFIYKNILIVRLNIGVNDDNSLKKA